MLNVWLRVDLLVACLGFEPMSPVFQAENKPMPALACHLFWLMPQLQGQK